MKINDIYKYFACFFSCFFIVFSPAFLLWWHAPILHSVLLMAYYIPLNILILFDAVALFMAHYGAPAFYLGLYYGRWPVPDF